MHEKPLACSIFSHLRSYRLARGTRPNEKKDNCKCTLVKTDSKECKTITWSAEK